MADVSVGNGQAFSDEGGKAPGQSLISVVIPCFNEEESLPILLEALQETRGPDSERASGDHRRGRRLHGWDARRRQGAGGGGSAHPVYLLLQKLRQGGGHVRRAGKRRRRICLHSGRRYAGLSGPSAADGGDRIGRGVRLRCGPARHPGRGAEAALLFCPAFLRAHGEDVLHRDRGGGAGLPPDEQAYGGRRLIAAGDQPVFQGDFRLGGLQDQMD